jgi:hypothetical protein
VGERCSLVQARPDLEDCQDNATVTIDDHMVNRFKSWIVATDIDVGKHAMILIYVLVALPIALLVGALVAKVFDRHTSVVRLPLFFLAIFLGAWSGGLRTLPFQEWAWAVYWVPFLAGGMLIAMVVILVSMMPYFRKSADESTKPRTERTTNMTLMEGFLWTLSTLLAVPILLHHFGGSIPLLMGMP